MKKFRTTPEVKKLEQHSEHKDAELIMRLKKGDDKALECLFKYRDELLKYLLSITHSVEESEDIIQDVFMTVWDNRENIDEQNNFKSYIFKIAKNRMIDMYRKFLKTEPLQPDTVAVERQTPESVLLEVEKRKILQEAVDHLSPQQKKIYMLHYEQKKCLKEIAIEMNISLSAVQNYVNKVRKKIIDYFEKKNYF